MELTSKSHALGLGSGPQDVKQIGPLAYLRRRSTYDWIFLALIVGGDAYVLSRYGQNMNYYVKLIFLGATTSLLFLGWGWTAIKNLAISVAVLSLFGIWLYNGPAGVPVLARGEQNFFLKYFLSSQTAIMWMAFLFFLSTASYWVGMFTGPAQSLAGGTMTAGGPVSEGAMIRDGRGWQSNFPQLFGSRLAWVGITMALVGTMMRWFESYLIGPDVGHIPLSNLYEVFVLFSWLTTALYLYFEHKYKTRSMGAFAMLVVSAAVVFLLWFSFAQSGFVIQPLVPALQSWWMKIHVPANFIGYGTFAIAAMVGFAYLIKAHATTTSLWKLAPLWLLGFTMFFEPMVFRQGGISEYWGVFAGISALIVGGILYGRKRIAMHLPSMEVMDDVMYKSIAIGFTFFTIATILGAMWAAQAWGGYWSWDPKETWALIVWLNYAAWLHMRLMKGLRGQVAAWWALTGLLVTTFAFLGVNMFLSGLHSYGKL
ncbi:MAG: c-type cytochrome biogenesis protein CcsB [Betaproteobacteria bacterium]|nr:c-type cytochrome biogenesis protein CcsB [Betaproteobacteria bacterium]MDE2123770.1 c-type cytochrome biogenesis protein CcsB [Betaproteobacteria bacterium]MDE2185158.1 c-type cytochrome biogenesis protein CcsB [Betaproteobacteria bacterium]MDE2324105.1 c-type cytochrome biogenesis protein CcsB [Betaproteobacteria bacterium]